MSAYPTPAALSSCDTMVVLAPQTRAGATLLAKNSDRAPLECQPLFQAPRRSHRPRDTVHCQYLEVPQAPETLAVIGSRPFWLWGFEHGINEHGVAIGNEAVMTREPLPATGLLGMDLVRLGLERGKTAREAVEVIGGFIEHFGQGGSGAHEYDFRYSGGFVIADHAGAYILESSGRQWIARRVEECGSISNLLTSTGYDFGSDDVQAYARERGWWDGAAPFDFSAVYSLDDTGDPLSARERIARSRELLARGGRRTVREMFAMLRDHYEMGEMPVISAPAGSERSFSLCMHNLQGTTASMVAELPAPGTGAPAVMWASMAAPCTSIFIPLFVEGAIPPVLAAGTAGPSAQSPWWKMKEIQDLVARDPSRLAPLAWEHLRPLESAMLERTAEVVHKARGLDSARRRELLSEFMAHNVVRSLNTAEQLRLALTRETA
jgi:secernin